MDRKTSKLYKAILTAVAPGGRSHPFFKSIYEYVGGSNGINTALREKNGCIEDLAEGNTKEHARNIYAMLMKLPSYQGIVYRAMGQCEDTEPNYTMDYIRYLMSPGAVHRENGFVST